jgi:hypothetical protein
VGGGAALAFPLPLATSGGALAHEGPLVHQRRRRFQTELDGEAARVLVAVEQFDGAVGDATVRQTMLRNNITN